MDFVAIDVETANADQASICQIGLAYFQDGKCQEEWKSYVNPEDYFEEINISIHGITSRTVKDAPKFPTVFDRITKILETTIIVSHMPFDKIAVTRAAEKYDLALPESRWLDSAKVTRRAWEQCSKKGYGLGNIAKILGLKFEHHDAGEDARAAGLVILAACEKDSMTVEEWLDRTGRPIDPNSEFKAAAVEVNPLGSLFGEEIVFTGSLEIPRREAAKLAGEAGCKVTATVRKSTTLLIVGDQDTRSLGGKEKSSKHRKAEGLIQQGQQIRILTESDFKNLVRI
ncbi:MAG: transposase [Elusimicrobia bacterium]|nr:MAG: transposase [Elusimicrobiota bacterium]